MPMVWLLRLYVRVAEGPNLPHQAKGVCFLNTAWQCLGVGLPAVVAVATTGLLADFVPGWVGGGRHMKFLVKSANDKKLHLSPTSTGWRALQICLPEHNYSPLSSSIPPTCTSLPSSAAIMHDRTGGTFIMKQPKRLSGRA
jgi:hypothetical protein